MIKVGLTGGIGSGKSTVAQVFEVLGIPVYSSDLASRRLMNEDPDLINSIKDIFSDKAYEGGKLNRSYLASLVFDNKEKLAQLNALVHPATIRDGDKWIAAQNGPYAIRESSLIFEAGMQGSFDLVIGVSAPKALRIQRVMERDGINREAVLARMQHQIQENVKMRLCDIVILNDDQHPVLVQALDVHQRILALAGASPSPLTSSAGNTNA